MSPRRRPPARMAVVGLVVAVLVAAVVADRTRQAPAAVAPFSANATGDPVVPSAEALSSAWYCADGTAAPGGTRDETILLANVGRESTEAVVTVLPGGTAAPVSTTVSMPPYGDARVRVGDLVVAPNPGVVVQAFGGQVIVEHVLASGGDFSVGPCSRGPAADWYFAAGTTVAGAQDLLSVFNPFGDDAVVDITLLNATGPTAPEPLQGLVVSRRSRITIPVQDHIERSAPVAVVMHARVGRVVAERTTLLDGRDGRRGLATSLGATRLAREWFFPRAPQLAGEVETLVVANPGDRPAALEYEILIDGDVALGTQVVDVAARAVAVLPLGMIPAGLGYAIVVRAVGTQAVVAETFTSWSVQRGIASMIGSPTAATRWYFTAGRYDNNSDGAVSILNPGTEPVTATVLHRVPGRLDLPTSAPEIVLGPGKRLLVDMRSLGVLPGELIEVGADRPIVVAETLAGPTGTSLAPGVPLTESSAASGNQ